MEKQETKKISFSIADIHISKFYIENLPENVKNSDSLNLRYGLNMAIFDDLDTIMIITNIEFFREVERINKFCELTSEISYKILNFKENFPLIDGKYNIPPVLASTLYSVAYSTTRGLLVAKTSGTILHGAYLPLIDPKAFVLPQEGNKNNQS